MKTRILALALAFISGLSLVSAAEVPVWTKLETWIVPEVAMENLSLGEAVAWVRAKSREIDPAGKDRENAGVRIGFERLGAGEPERLVTVKAKAISLGDLIDRIGRMTNRSVEIYDQGVVLRFSREPVLADGMVARVFRVPGNFGDASYYDPEETGALKKKPAKGTRDVRELFENNGIHFGEGASAFMIPKAGVLAVRNTVSQMELVEAYLTFCGPDDFAFQVRVRAEVYAMDTKLAFELSRIGKEQSDATALCRELVKRVALGEAELVALPMIVTRSGQRAKIESGWSRDLVTGYKIEDGKDSATSESISAGVTFEVDPVIGADQRTIDLNVALKVPIDEPEITQTEILAPVSEKPVMVESLNDHAASLLTAIATLSGQPQLMGIIPARTGSDKTLLVIVTATVIKVSESFPVPE